MKRVLCGLVLGLGILGFVRCSGGQQTPKNIHIVDTAALSPERQQKLFHLPAGFVIELVAAEPDINKPINIAFDARGRLWVTGSVEYPIPAEKGKTPRDRVTILDDFAENGRARKIVTYADGLNIPIGVLPLPGADSAVVFSIPSIFRMTGAHKAEKREAIYTGYGYRDTHGMTGEFVHGFDGWIYCCHGYSNTSKATSKSNQSITMQSGNTYRIKPDGSRIEYFTHGQVNPFGLALDEAGNLYSCDCHSMPIYQLLRGAWYPSFEKPHDGLGFGPDMMKHDHGSTAIAGIAYLADEQWPTEFRNNLVIGNVITNRINRDRLEWNGASPKAIEMPDLVKCDDPWFRPVDIKLGPDGNLYVADFYNRIIGHYEVPLDHPGRDREKGRIWRIRYVGEDGQARGRSLTNYTKRNHVQLMEHLNDGNLPSRMLATHELVRHGGADVERLCVKAAREGSRLQKIHSLWVLERLEKLDEETLAKAAASSANLVRIHAMRVLAERETWSNEDRKLVLAALHDADAMVLRIAVEALGRHPAADNIPLLLAIKHKVPAADSHLLHTVRMALRDQLLVKEGWTALAANTWTEKDARALADVALGARSRPTAEFLMRFLERWEVDVATLELQGHYIARFGPDGAASWVIDFARRRHAIDALAVAKVLLRVQQATEERGSVLPEKELRWAEGVTRQLLASDPGHVEMGIELAAALKFASATQALLELVSDAKLAEKMRKSALVALLAVEPDKNTEALAALLNNPKEPLSLRAQIITGLAATNRAEAHSVLIKAIESAPAVLQTTIAVGLASSTQGAERLLLAIAAGKASARLLQERPIEIRIRQTRVANLNERLAALTKGLPPADQRLQELLAKRRDGFRATKTDPQIGVKVFEKHCIACHQVASKGAKIAPQLDGIGSRGLERLLEDTLDPNRNVDQAFRSTTLVLNNGQIVSGLFLRQEGQVLIMADAQGKEVRVPVSSVAERSPSPLSPMPSNFAEQISETEFHHLMAYLLAQRPKN